MQRSFLLLLGLLGSGCGPGAAAQAVRPAAPTAQGALGGTGLVVDWPSEKRADLELALKHERVVLVQVQGAAVNVVAGCHAVAERDYRSQLAPAPLAYVRDEFSPKSDVLELKDADAVRASLPRTSAVWIEGGIERGAALELALVSRARLALDARARRISRSQVRQEGKYVEVPDGPCAAATHYVASAVVGAFALRTNTEARVHTAAEVFGGGGNASSDSARKLATRDGNLEACNAPAGEGCSVPLRVELHALEPRSELRVRCEDDHDPELCGEWLQNAKSPADAKAALVAVRAACSKNEPEACNAIVRVQSYRDHPVSALVGDAEADQAAEVGCRYLFGSSCVREASRLRKAGKDAEAMDIHARSCTTATRSFDDVAACSFLLAHAEAQSLPSSSALPLGYAYARECLNNAGEMCFKFAKYRAAPLTNSQQERIRPRAQNALRECEANPQSDSCVQTAAVHAFGLGVPKDRAKARAIWQTRCKLVTAKGETCEAYPAGW